MPVLDWIGKHAVVSHHREVPFHLLRCREDLSVGDPGSGNLLVQADNLLALKALLPYYAGTVKCIYIDPPYNTGNENWVYNDNVNSPEMREWLGKVVGAEGEDLSRHDKWLCMMYPRLCLLRDLLSENGAIFVSMDDGEVAHLRDIMDDIFGKDNFLANIVWQKKQSPQNDAINFSDMHDHILVYAKRAKSNRNDQRGWQRNMFARGEQQSRRYCNPDKDPRGDWTSADLTVNKTSEERPNLYYSIINPNTGLEVWPSKRRVWLFEKSVMERLISEQRIWWGKTGRNMPRLKKYLAEVAEGVVPSTWWPRSLAGDNQEARRELRRMFDDRDEDVFPTPKPVRLISRILEVATSSDDLVLDSFAGSGTTGHAVLKANTTDGGQRRFILVEMEQSVAESVTCERLRRAIEGHGGSGRLVGDFRYCVLGPALFDADGRIQESVSYEDLARHIFFVETGEPLPEVTQPTWPLLGVARGTGVYLLYNGVLRDKSVDGGNVLTRALMAALPPHEGPKVIYGTGCRISEHRLRQLSIIFRQIPYQVRAA